VSLSDRLHGPLTPSSPELLSECARVPVCDAAPCAAVSAPGVPVPRVPGVRGPAGDPGPVLGPAGRAAPNSAHLLSQSLQI
jgi:hypothetical protein